MSYYPAFICENGHTISSSSDACTDRFCSTCGGRVFNQCPECHKQIRGKYRDSIGLMAKYKVPAYCRDCGKPYPWTKIAIETTVLMLEEEANLTFADRQKLIEVLPDAITETPKTPLAAIRIRKAIETASSFVAEGLRQFVIDFGCELLKNKIGLS